MAAFLLNALLVAGASAAVLAVGTVGLVIWGAGQFSRDLFKPVD